MLKTFDLHWNSCDEKVSTKSEGKYFSKTNNEKLINKILKLFCLSVRRQRALAALNVTESIAMEREGKRN
jgi:hypothetical protein